MNFRKFSRKQFIAGGLLALSVAGLGAGQALLQNQAEAQRETVQAPMFEVDPFWPKPLPKQ